MKWFFFVVAVLFLTACSTKVPHYEGIETPNSVKESKERQLVARFAEYWYARKTGNMKKAFEFELPSQRYVDGWDGYSQKVTPVNKDLVIVLKDITYVHPHVAIVEKLVKIKDRRLLQKEKWIYIDGKWYHKYRQNIFPIDNNEENETF